VAGVEQNSSSEEDDFFEEITGEGINHRLRLSDVTFNRPLSGRIIMISMDKYRLVTLVALVS